jgi:hypothetical protein
MSEYRGPLIYRLSDSLSIRIGTKQYYFNCSSAVALSSPVRIVEILVEVLSIRAGFVQAWVNDDVAGTSVDQQVQIRGVSDCEIAKPKALSAG